jgi:hypothetical protein
VTVVVLGLDTRFASGSWVGVELFEPNGQHNGTVSGVQYFTCKLAPAELLSSDPKSPTTSDLFQDSGCYGVFVRPGQIEMLTSDARAADATSASGESDTSSPEREVAVTRERTRTEKGKMVKRPLTFAEQKRVEPAVYEWFAGLGFSDYLSSFYHAAVASLSTGSSKKPARSNHANILTMKWIALLKRSDLVRMGVEKWHRKALVNAITLLRESLTGLVVPASDNPAVREGVVETERETPIGWATGSEDEKAGTSVGLSTPADQPAVRSPAKKVTRKKKKRNSVKSAGTSPQQASPVHLKARAKGSPAKKTPNSSPSQASDVHVAASGAVESPRKTVKSTSKRKAARFVGLPASTTVNIVESAPSGNHTERKAPPHAVGSAVSEVQPSNVLSLGPIPPGQPSPKKWFAAFSMLDGDGVAAASGQVDPVQRLQPVEKRLRFQSLASAVSARHSEAPVDTVDSGKSQLQLPIPQVSQLVGLQQSIVVQKATANAAEALSTSLSVAESVQSHSPTARIQKLLTGLEIKARDDLLHEEMAKLSAWEASDTVDDWLTSLGCFQHSALFRACGVNDLSDVCLLHEVSWRGYPCSFMERGAFYFACPLLRYLGSLEGDEAPSGGHDCVDECCDCSPSYCSVIYEKPLNAIVC